MSMDFKYIFRERILFFFIQNYLRKISIIRFFFLKKKIKSQKYYQIFDKKKIQKLKKSNSVVIFGSGFSINSITSEEWKLIEKMDTLSFNYFFKCDKVRIDHHIIREVGRDDSLQEYVDGIQNNKQYSNANYFICEDSHSSYDIIHNKLLNKGSKIFFYQNRHLKGLITTDIGKEFTDISHKHTSLEDGVNIAYLLGYKNIILAGVDMYDSRYFWLNKNETRNTDVRMKRTHLNKWGNTNEVCILFKKWIPQMKKEGVNMFVLNPKSLLKVIVPIWDLKKREKDN
jgi:hypothetical protein